MEIVHLLSTILQPVVEPRSKQILALQVAIHRNIIDRFLILHTIGKEQIRDVRRREATRQLLTKSPLNGFLAHPTVTDLCTIGA